jgi:glutamine amidotransferase
MITIIDYRAGNLTSVKLAFDTLGIPTVITGEADKILSADKIVFPGVGAADAAMTNLKQLKLIEPIKKQIAEGVPFLGVCLGMQILFSRSEEDNGTICLGILEGEVNRFLAPTNDVKIPHMGWNSVEIMQKHPIFEGIENQSEFYFVHGYYPITKVKKTIYGVTDYAGVKFTSAVGKNNVIATQFHPEKSGRIGLKMLANFNKWNGQC